MEHNEQVANDLLDLIGNMIGAVKFFTLQRDESMSYAQEAERLKDASRQMFDEIIRDARKECPGEEVELGRVLRSALFRCYQELDAAIKAQEVQDGK